MFRSFKYSGENVFEKLNNLSMICSKTNKWIKVLFNLLFTNYQENMFEKMKGCNFLFDYTDPLYFS